MGSLDLQQLDNMSCEIQIQVPPTIPHLLLGNTYEAAGWQLDGEEKLQFSALLNGRIYSNAGPQRLLLIRLNEFELKCQGNTSLDIRPGGDTLPQILTTWLGAHYLA